MEFAGPPEREEERLEEDLRRPDDLEHERDEQHAAQLRERDVPHLAPEPCAVDRRRLVERAVDRRSARRGR